MLRRLVAVATATLVGATLLLAASWANGGPGSRSGAAQADVLNLRFTASNGLASRYHVFGAGLPSEGRPGLLLQFHGDGAYEFHNSSSSYSLGGPSGIVAAGNRHGLLVIAALSPDRDGAVTWWEQGEANADYASDLIADIAFRRYNVDPSNIWLVGYSGGAQFITQFFLPKHAMMINGGGSIAFGGGGAPRVPGVQFSASLKDRFSMHWYTGADDDGRNGTYNALRDARRGSRWYSRQGFATTRQFPAGVGHDDIAFGQVVAERLTEAGAP